MRYVRSEARLRRIGKRIILDNIGLNDYTALCAGRAYELLKNTDVASVGFGYDEQGINHLEVRLKRILSYAKILEMVKDVGFGESREHRQHYHPSDPELSHLYFDRPEVSFSLSFSYSNPQAKAAEKD